MGLKPGPAPTAGATPALPGWTERRPGCALAGFGLPVGAGAVVVVVTAEGLGRGAVAIGDGNVWMSGALVSGPLPQPTSRPAVAAQASTARVRGRARYKEPPGTLGG
jgi:hypothetical protein